LIHPSEWRTSLDVGQEVATGISQAENRLQAIEIASQST